MCREFCRPQVRLHRDAGASVHTAPSAHPATIPHSPEGGNEDATINTTRIYSLADFNPHTWDALYDAGAALKAKAILVAGDDPDEARLTENYARLCEVMQPYGMTADLEFMPWTAVPDAHTARCERLFPGEGGIDVKGLFAALPVDLL